MQLHTVTLTLDDDQNTVIEVWINNGNVFMQGSKTEIHSKVEQKIRTLVENFQQELAKKKIKTNTGAC